MSRSIVPINRDPAPIGPSAPPSFSPTFGPDGPAIDPCSHVANAARIVHHFGARILYVQGIGWHIWGPPWRHNELAVRGLVQGLGKLVAAEAEAMIHRLAGAKDSAESEQRVAQVRRLRLWARECELERNIEASLRLAASHLSCDASELDASPLLLGTPLGVLELETLESRAHRQSDRITRTTGCHLDLNATAPRWNAFVDQITRGDVELSRYLQKLAGYALSGLRREHLLPVVFGPGANGKSVFLGVLQEVFGDYGGSAPPGLLIQKSYAEHPTGLASLQGKRLIIASESGDGARLNEEQVKLLTGGDQISARRMYQNYFTFSPTHLLLLQTNHRPRISGTDEGIWRRIHLIPFEMSVPVEDRDTRLRDKLLNEREGILAWCVEGWRLYQRDGLKAPKAVRLATRDYRTSSDVLGLFLGDRCEMSRQATVKIGELYDAYVHWSAASGEQYLTARDFNNELARREFVRDRGTRGARIWRGLSLRLRDEGG